ncbi:tubulin delta chain-like [Ruditapes philippinarum]|uniref:tubulin delta chain-like n=1 Tax=Ruditapes philippinarum TaxID=129788 RepID=UPI00295B9801|nr:tubulin delta chain-like [Ruditapes philippinarum]
MSTVFVQIGQCGNQVGHAFWKRIMKDEEVNKSSSFIAKDGKFRAVVVDSEPKVIRKITKGLPFREESVITGKRGRGTNWALGYHGLKRTGDDHLLEDTLEAIRKEIERCDCFSGIIMLHSLSGGTGSGFGSRLAEILRDRYPMHHLMSCVFAPHASGESPLQHYNSLLTLATLQRTTDCVILTHNDDVLHRVQKKKGQEAVSYSHLNEAIASHLSGIFLPTESLRAKSAFSLGMEPWEMLRSICPMPNLKFVQIAQYMNSKMSWSDLLSKVSATIRRYDSSGNPYSSLGNICVARGDTTGGFQLHMGALEPKLKRAYNCVDWNPFPVDFWTAKPNNCGSKNSASLTVASNSSSINEYLENVLERSKVMFEAGAYLHWYWRHGADKETFEDAFETIQLVVDDYKTAVK